MRRLIMKDINWLLAELKVHFENDATGHDYWHAERVWKSALTIGKQESANLKIIEAAALLHDVTDWKLDQTSQIQGQDKMEYWLGELDYSTDEIRLVTDIINNMSYKGGTNNHKILSLEGQVVQDADRLDALGAIGIARAFAYGGSKGRPLHDPSQDPKDFESFKAYKNHKGATINHFYEKLLKLKDLMNTSAGKMIALERHKYMEGFLKEFYGEWEGKL